VRALAIRPVYLPARDEPLEDIARLGVEADGEEGLWLEFAGRIADQEPADRNR